MSEFMSIQEAMAALKICRSTLYKHMRSGRLTAYRVGRLVRITREDLEDFVKQGHRNCRRATQRQN